MTAHTISPMMDEVWMPSRLKVKPPTEPPTIPRKRFTRQPFPSLPVNLQAMKPAIIPAIILPIIILSV